MSRLAAVVVQKNVQDCHAEMQRRLVSRFRLVMKCISKLVHFAHAQANVPIARASVPVISSASKPVCELAVFLSLLELLRVEQCDCELEMRLK